MPVFEVRVKKPSPAGRVYKNILLFYYVKIKIQLAWFNDRLTIGHHSTGFDQKFRQNSVIRSIYQSKLAHGALSGRSARIGATERRIELNMVSSFGRYGRYMEQPRTDASHPVPSAPGQAGPIGTTLAVACAGRSRARLPKYGASFPGNYRNRVHDEMSTLA